MSWQKTLSAFGGALSGYSLGHWLTAPEVDVDYMQKALQNEAIWSEIAQQALIESFTMLKNIYSSTNGYKLPEPHRTQFNRIQADVMGIGFYKEHLKVTPNQVCQVVRYWEELIKYLELIK